MSTYFNAPRSQRKRRYLSPREHRAIRHLVLECAESMADVARDLGLSYWTVRDIAYGRRRPRAFLQGMPTP